ncbi:MAG: hypothetical protein RL428_9 [Actinomycetota bacterium]
MKIEEFREYARSNNVIPVYRKVLADSETPLGIYKKLAKNNPGTFLLESAEHGGGLEHLPQEFHAEWIRYKR